MKFTGQFLISFFFLECVKILLEAGAKATVMEVKAVIENGNLEILDVLLQHISKGELEQNAKANKHHLTPLHYAVYHGNLEMVKRLVEKGANIHAIADENCTVATDAFNLAAKGGYTDVVNYFRKEHNMDVNNLHYAVFHMILEGEVEKLEPLVGMGLNLSKMRWPGVIETPLDEAVLAGSIPIIEALVRLGMDVNGNAEDEYVPLSYAVSKDRPEVVKRLIELGADVNMRSPTSAAPIFHAKTLENLQILLNAGVY